MVWKLGVRLLSITFTVNRSADWTFIGDLLYYMNYCYNKGEYHLNAYSSSTLSSTMWEVVPHLPPEIDASAGQELHA